VSELEAYLNELPVEGEEGSARRFGARISAKYEPVEQEAVEGPGGYPIITDPTNPLKAYYDRLGFDPATMGEDDMRRLMDAAEDRWKASIPGTPLGKREREALRQLANFDVGVSIKPSEIKNCGPDTQDRLAARGYLEVQYDRDRIVGYVLTEGGLKAAKLL
jgi:hypothetical protein